MMTCRSDWHVVYGPPGTGKTTFGMRYVEERLKRGVPPSQIGYISFTKQAAIEARRRAMDQFDLVPDDLPYFRTIHSLCFQQLSLRPDKLMQKSNWFELGEIIGVEVSGQQLNEDAYALGMPIGDRLFFLDNLARITKRGLRAVYEDTVDDDLSYDQLIVASKALAKYKAKHMLWDFTDILDRFVAKGAAPRLQSLFVDEAQDLSKLQWEVVHKLSQNVEELYAAGDDDQAIYRWAGASVEDFIELPGTRTVLDRSFRVPDAVHKLACEVSGRIEKRANKEFRPSGVDGYVDYQFSVDDLDLSTGQWLLLARNAYLLRDYERICEQNGYAYESPSRKPLQSKALEAIKDWTRLGKGETVYGRQLKNIRRFHGFKMRQIDDERIYTLTDLPVDYGPWHEVFERISPTLAEYFLAARRNGEKLGKPRIKISTIHGVKGGEADHVAIITDLAARSHRYMQMFPDDEHRVFYVGLTRAKQGVTIIQPNSRMFYEI